MFSGFDSQTRQILTGNLLLVVCCVFYLLWWLIAFHPTHAVKGFRSGWLLIPAFIFGIWAVVRIAMGCSVGEDIPRLLPGAGIAVAGVVVYILLLAGTLLLMKRQVTTELLLIVGWTVLMFLELNAMYGLGHFTKFSAILFMVISVIAAIISLICYLLYYNLGSVTGYVDGTIPLVMVALMMIVTTLFTVLKGS